MIFDELWRAELRAQKESSRLEATYRPRLKAAEGEKDREKYESILWAYLDLRGLIDEPEVIRTKRLLKRARKLGIPIPPKPARDADDLSENKNWCFNQGNGNYYLTDEAELRLTREIRTEEIERLQHRTR